MDNFTGTDASGASRVCKGPNSIIQICVSLAGRLTSTALLSSGATVTITSDTESAPTLTASSVSINAAEFTDQTDSTRTVAIGKGVEFLLSGGTAGTCYTVEVYATADDGTKPDCKFGVCVD